MKRSCVSNFWSRISPALTQNFSADDWNVSFRTFCIGGFSNKWITVLVTGLKTDLINQSQPKTVESERLRLFTFFAYTRIKQGKGELWSSPVTTSRAFHLSSKDSSEPNLNTGPGLCQVPVPWKPQDAPLLAAPEHWGEETQGQSTGRNGTQNDDLQQTLPPFPGWKSGCCLPLLIYTAFRRRKIKPSAHRACEERGEETPKAVDIHKVIF